MTIVNSACNNCAAEAIVWERLNQQYSHVGFLAVLISATPNDIKQYHHVTFPVTVGDLDIARALRALGSPAIRVVRHDKALAFQADGPAATMELEKWLNTTSHPNGS